MSAMRSIVPNRRSFLSGAGALGAAAVSRRAWAAGADAELILTGGQIWSPNGYVGTAIAIGGNHILAVGTDSAVRRLAGRGTRIVDIKGRFVMPGFNDSHVHVTGMANQYYDVRLLGSRTIADVVQRIRERAAKTPPGEWVLARGQWHEALLTEGRMPTRKDLDPVSPDNPVYIPRGGHVATVNSKALQLAGITRHTPNPPGGIIVRDADGEPTGLLLEHAVGLMRRLLKPLGSEQYHEALKAQIDEMSAAGLTSVTNPGASMDQAQHLLSIHRANQLKVRVNWTAPARSAEDVRKLRSHLAPLEGDSVLRFSGLGEVGVDGGIEGAYLREPYMIVPGEQEDPAYRGVLMPLAANESELEELYLAAIDAEYNVMTHITGDAALDAGLNTLSRVAAKKDFRNLRWTLHGCFLTDDAQLAKVKKMGLYITAQTQPLLLGAQMAIWWGSERANRSIPFKAFLDAGIPTGGGSDASAGIWLPMKSMAWMVNRLCMGDVQFDKKWSLTPEQALSIYTAGSAQTQFMEDKLGTLAPGMLADLAILADNPLKIPAAEISTIENDVTIMNGSVVFDRHGILS